MQYSSPIHNKPTSQLTRPEGHAADMLGSDTRGDLWGSCGVAPLAAEDGLHNTRQVDLTLWLIGVIQHSIVFLLILFL